MPYWKPTFVVSCLTLRFVYNFLQPQTQRKHLISVDQLKANVSNKLILNAFTDSPRPAW